MPTYRPVLERFVAKFELDPQTGCWNWAASLSRKGYGKFQTMNGCFDAHKVSFEIFMGLVPRGTELHHICNNRRCVNPNHMNPLSHHFNCQWHLTRNQPIQCLPHRLGQFVPYPEHTEAESAAYWAMRDAKRLIRNAKLTGRPAKPLIDRWAAQVTRLGDSDCLIWMGQKEKAGYGRMCCREFGRSHGQMAHRISYMLFVGDIPAGMTVDHICRNTSCVNPNHLRLMTRSDNSDGGVCGANAKKTHCPHGHPFNDINTYPRPLKSGRIGRGCKVCKTYGHARFNLLMRLGLPPDAKSKPSS